jgi:Fe-S cluster assembly protein SufD
VIADKGTGVFNGKIFIREQAKKTEAHQTNKNILLSENATVYAKPHLEIYADDVKCTHGSSTGQLDKTALFYLRSRGIKEEKARKLLTEAFSSDIIDRARLSPYREWLRRGHETK